MQPILLSEGCGCNGLVRLMSGRKPVDQAVGCSGEHVYMGRCRGLVGDSHTALSPVRLLLSKSVISQRKLVFQLRNMNRLSA